MDKPTVAEEAPVDQAQLAMQLRTRGLVRTIASLERQQFLDKDATFLEAVANILNSADAPSPHHHIEEALQELEGPRFFLVQHVLCDLIPHLNIEQNVLLAFVARLIDKGGNDGAAGAPGNAFGEWTKKDPSRPTRVYEAARSGDDLALSQLYTTLRVNADVEEGLTFAQADEREAKLAAISALGFMELGQRYEKVLGALLHEAASDDEDTALRSLEAGFRAATRRKELAPAGFDQQLERVLKTRSRFAVHLAADLLWLYREGLSQNALDLCFDAVADVDPSATGTISHVDHAAYQLVSDGGAERVVRLICQMIVRSNGLISLDAFQSTLHALQNAGADVLGDGVVYWLLEGDTHTRKCVAREVCSVGNDSPPFSIAPSSLPPDAMEQLFLCRKAVGWFFIDPLAAVAIPLAVLRDGSPGIANHVLDLIYDPLLLSYGGKLKKYLERYIAEEETNASSLAELLARKAALQDATEGIERLVEMHPSETHREAERVQWREQTERGMVEGSRKSFFDDLFTKQYILYGRSSLTPIHNGEGETHLTEIKMQSFSVSSELPLLDIVDPVGLEHMLIHFKLESRKQQ
jgi:hypothetical protein